MSGFWLFHRCFFKHFPSKNQLAGLSINGTLVENGLNVIFRFFIRAIFPVSFSAFSSQCSIFIPPRKIRKPLVFCFFRGDQKETLGRKGLTAEGRVVVFTDFKKLCWIYCHQKHCWRLREITRSPLSYNFRKILKKEHWRGASEEEHFQKMISLPGKASNFQRLEFL